MGIKFSSAFLVLIAVLCTLIGFQNCSPGFKAIAPQGTRLLESAVPAQLEVTVSQTGAAEFTQHRSVTFSFSPANQAAENAIASYECSLDSGPYVACTSPHSLSGLADGSHSIALKALGKQGEEKVLYEHSWKVDTEKPTVTIVNKPALVTSSSMASITFTSIDSGSGISAIECSLDGASRTACAGIYEVKDLKPGSHAVTVYAFDRAANLQSENVQWTIDTSAPAVPTVSGMKPITNAKSFTVSVASPDPDTKSLECRIDAATFTVCKTPFTITESKEGTHKLEVVAIDSVGNRSPAGAATWILDTTLPMLTLAGPAAMVTATDASIGISATDANDIASMTCKLDTLSAMSCMSPATYTNLTSGPHTVLVKVVDGAGNEKTATHSWTVGCAAGLQRIAGACLPPLKNRKFLSKCFSVSSTYSLVAYNEYINESEVGGVTTGTNVNAEYYFNKGAESPNHVCAILTEIFRTNSKYSIPGIVKNGGGTAPFNFDVMQMDITIISRGRQVAHPQIVEAYNSTSVCGKTNWILSTDYSFVLPAPCGGAGPEAKWPTMKTLNGINPSPAAPEPSYLAVGDFSAGMVQTAYPPRARTDLNMYEVEDCSLPNARRAVRFKYDIPNYKTSQECMALECQPGFYNTGTCVN